LKCNYDLTESIPVGMDYQTGPVVKSTFESFKHMIDNAKHTLDIAQYYFSLIGQDTMPDSEQHSCSEGQHVLDSLLNALKRGVRMRITLNYNSQTVNDKGDILLNELKQLKELGAEIRFINFQRLLEAGILHTKFIIADDKDLYIGSSNMDWRALTQVKELGITLWDCNLLAKDLLKIFEVYWILGENDSVVPQTWPQELSTGINATHPIQIQLNDHQSQVYMSSSPKELNPFGRTNDLEAVLDVINRADKFINIAVMDYFPVYLFTGRQEYWPDIDTALRRAAVERGVRVRLMASKWKYTRSALYGYLKSLSAIQRVPSKGSINTKMFAIPATDEQLKIPFSRTNHNKYVVTDKDVLIGTSNWSADYFMNSGGVSFVSYDVVGDQEVDKETVADDNEEKETKQSLRELLTQVFERDWNSEYAFIV